MAEIVDFIVTDDSNTARWPEGMAPASVNNSARADEGILARWYKDNDGSITSSGSSNAYAITSNRTISALVNNTVMAWTANHTNTGASTLNLNGLGAVAIRRPNSVVLVANDIVSDQAVLTIYKSAVNFWFLLSSPGAQLPASDTVAGALEIAIQSEMESASSAVLAVTPGRQHFHPGHPKAGGNFDGSGVPAFRSGDYGMGAITDNGTGNYTLAIDTAFNDTNYWVTGFARSTSTGRRAAVSANPADTKTSTSFQVRVDIFDGSAAPVDSTEVGVSFWGDYA